jgi:hypothetical protein
MEVVGLPETFVTAYQAAWSYNPEQLNLNIRRRKNYNRLINILGTVVGTVLGSRTVSLG